MKRPGRKQLDAQSPTEAMGTILYARVSSKEQEKEGFSIPAQLKLLHEYAQAKSFRVAREFVDVETAKAAGRTHFREMVKFLQGNPQVKTLLVEKLGLPVANRILPVLQRSVARQQLQWRSALEPGAEGG